MQAVPQSPADPCLQLELGPCLRLCPAWRSACWVMGPRTLRAPHVASLFIVSRENMLPAPMGAHPGRPPHPGSSAPGGESSRGCRD